jgi:hypothetical protein
MYWLASSARDIGQGNCKQILRRFGGGIGQSGVNAFLEKRDDLLRFGSVKDSSTSNNDVTPCFREWKVLNVGV